MKRTVLYYGIALALLLGFLKYIEYRYMVRDLSIEFYLGIVALFFSGLGVWAGLRWANKHASAAPKDTAKSIVFLSPTPDLEATLAKLGISKREHEVLCLIAEGHSNQEIADQLFLSLNTVKSHSSNLFSKLDVKRRTQAIQRAKDLGLLSSSAGTFG
ncbi:MAG: response regulator transcription factor [Saprospiraceae bacterium]|nr:response regulator transcription factor [Saprospiraceae bacterium]